MTVPLHSLIAYAMVPALEQLSPQFERTAGYKLVISGTTTGVAIKRIQSGETADLAILAGAATSDLAKQGKLDHTTLAVIASGGIGLAVRAGAPCPDISSVAAFKQALLSSKSVAYSDPADGGTSGIHFAQVLRRLGLVDQIRSKVTLVRDGGSAGDLVASGKVEFAVQMESELLTAKGAQLVGPLPQELQGLVIFTAAVFTASENAAAAKNFIRLLTSAKASSILKATGLQPANRVPAS